MQIGRKLKELCRRDAESIQLQFKAYRMMPHPSKTGVQAATVFCIPIRVAFNVLSEGAAQGEGGGTYRGITSYRCSLDHADLFREKRSL